MAGVLSGFSGSSSWNGGRGATALPVSEVLASTDHPIRFSPEVGTCCRFPSRLPRHEKPCPPMSKIKFSSFDGQDARNYTTSPPTRQAEETSKMVVHTPYMNRTSANRLNSIERKVAISRHNRKAINHSKCDNHAIGRIPVIFL